MNIPHSKNTSDFKQENKNLNDNTPLLFNKKNKKNKKNIIKNLTHINSDSGKTRHYTPAAQEWFNSIYTFNSTYTKTLPLADTSLMKLLKGYFNFETKRKILKTKPLTTKLKRLTTKKIFVGKGDLKHTSSKAIITFYVYNTTRMYLISKINELSKILYDPEERLNQIIEIENTKTDTKKTYIRKEYHLKEEITKMFHIKKKHKLTMRFNRPPSLSEFLTLPEKKNILQIKHKKNYLESFTRLYLDGYLDVQNLYLSNLNLLFVILSKMVKLNFITEQYKTVYLKDSMLRPLKSAFNYNLLENPLLPFLKRPAFEEYMDKAEEYYKSNLNRFVTLLRINRLKFRTHFITKLIYLVQNIYKKKVQFNIVNLKKMHLNSDIYTQAVALKLKDHKNRLYRVLKSSLRKVKVPTIYKKLEKFHKINKEDLYVNIIRNDNISSMFSNTNINDPLNNLLLNLYRSADDNTAKFLLKRKREKINLSFN